MREDEGSAADVFRVSVGGSRFRGGLFIASIEFHPDRVVFHVFASRTTSFAELQERMTLRDSAGTTYVMQPFEEIDGKGVFEFTPGVPPNVRSLVFGEPGTWLTLTELRDRDEQGRVRRDTDVTRSPIDPIERIP